MLLQRLPPELVLKVIEFSMPEGFENLMLSCRAIYKCGTPYISVHRAIKRKWRSVSINPPDNYRQYVVLLHKIAQEPVLAEYIVSIKVRQHEGMIQPRNEAEADAIQREFDLVWNDPASMAKIEALIAASPILRKADVRHPLPWFDKVPPDPEDGFSGMLFVLAFLKNVEELTIPHNWMIIGPGFHLVPIRPTEVESRVLRTVVDLRNDGQVGVPLRKLRSLALCAWPAHHVRVVLKSLSIFLAMPTLEEIHITSCTAVDNGETNLSFVWEYPSLHSALRTIELASSCMDATGIGNFLKHTPYLKEFRYSHQTKWLRVQRDWDPAAFLAAIATHCGPQLTHLALTVDNLGGDIISAIRSFQAFPRLESLEVDALLFTGLACESGHRLCDGPAPPGEVFTTWTPAATPPLADMLPRSLRACCLFVGREYDLDCFPLPFGRKPELLAALLKDFPSRRAASLPALESFRILHGVDDEPDDLHGDINVLLRQQAEAAGATGEARIVACAPWRASFLKKYGV